MAVGDPCQSKKEAHLDYCITKLINNGFAHALDMSRDALYDRLIRFVDYLKTAEDPEPGRSTFHIVIPFSLIPLYRQVSLTTALVRSRLQRVALDVLSAQTESDMPDEPYLILNADPGRAFQGLPANTCCKQFKQQGRLSATLAEGLAMYRDRPEILDQHGMNLPGTSCQNGMVPYLAHNAHGLVMDCNSSSSSDLSYGTASISRRIWWDAL